LHPCRAREPTLTPPPTAFLHPPLQGTAQPLRKTALCVMNRVRRILGGAELAVAIALVVGFLGSWRLQLESGTIGLFHDWSIAPAGSQNAAYAQQLFDGWYRWILGEPVFFPTEYPVRFAFGAAGAIGLGGDVVSHAFVFLVPAAAFFFAWQFARQLTGSQPGAIAAGLFYAFNPVMLNKMVSGQATYVVGYCALPLVLYAYRRAIQARSFLGAAAFFGATVALAGVQLQLGLVAAFLSILGCIIPCRQSGFRKRLAVLLTGFAVAAIVHLPTLVGASGGAIGYENRSQFSNNTTYLAMNSVAISDSVRLMGYLTRYATLAVQQSAWIWNAAMLVILLAVVVGIVTSSAAFRIFAVVALTLVFALVAGTKSPFGPAILWLFTHVRYMAVFRELYHLMAVPALVYACAIAFFVRFAQRLRARILIYSITSICLVLVCAPMLSGDASGWMRAFPLEQAYGDALSQQESGPNRVLWLPMDQPLSFKGYGAGVDPMAVIARGSLWDYSLNWPLTAVDADLHDGGDLKTALRALSVGDVVERQGMQSELARFTVDGLDAQPFLSRKVPLRLPLKQRYKESAAYSVDSAIPFVSSPSEVALVPQRLSLCAPAIVSGYAPIAFSDSRPADQPYVVVYDPDDIPQEALEFSRAANPLPTSGIDAREGFAPVSVWWWYRREYADVPSVSIAFGRQAVTVHPRRALRHATAIVAWIATANGGRLRISAPRRAAVIDTNGSGEWASRAIPLGSVTQNAAISVTSLDADSDVAVRSFAIVDAGEYARMRGRWEATMHAARTRILVRKNTRATFVRSGSSRNLGYLENGVRYRVDVSGVHGELHVSNSGGYPLARIASNQVVFTGEGDMARLTSIRAVAQWRLYRITEVPLAWPKPASRGHSRLAMWNWAYTPDWRTSIPARSFPSAIGTTIFEFSQPTDALQITFAKTPLFRIAYIVGCTVLILALLAGALVQKDPTDELSKADS